MIIKDVIAVAENGRENRKLLAIENTDKTVIEEVASLIKEKKLYKMQM